MSELIFNKIIITSDWAWNENRIDYPHTRRQRHSKQRNQIYALRYHYQAGFFRWRQPVPVRTCLNFAEQIASLFAFLMQAFHAERCWGACWLLVNARFVQTFLGHSVKTPAIVGQLSEKTTKLEPRASRLKLWSPKFEKCRHDNWVGHPTDSDYDTSSTCQVAILSIFMALN